MKFQISEKDKETLYEPERKVRFAEEYGATREASKNLMTLFFLSGQFERELDKDICAMNEDEVNRVLSNCKTARHSARYRYVKTLCAYRKWCVKKGIEVSALDHKRVSDVDTDVVRQRFVSSPLHLQANLDIFFDGVEKQNTDCIYRAFLWLAFSGVSRETVCDLRCGDIDFVNQRISYDGTSYPVYPESVPVLRFLAETDTLHYYNKNYKNVDGSCVIRKRVQGDRLLRGVRGEQDSNNIMIKITHRLGALRSEGKTDMRLTFSSVRRSGKFYREHARELAYGMTNLEALVAEEIAASGKEFQSEAEYKRYHWERACAVRKEYEAWLFAFGL